MTAAEILDDFIDLLKFKIKHDAEMIDFKEKFLLENINNKEISKEYLEECKELIEAYSWMQHRTRYYLSYINQKRK